jgi:hypothetical protein
MGEEETVTLIQKQGDRLALDHGGLAVFGDKTLPAMRHDVDGEVVHKTTEGQPLVHMVCWSEDQCNVEVRGRVVFAGDDEAPVKVAMTHRFEGEHRQLLQIEPVDHQLRVDTRLAEPIHHALQMRTPLQVRFCNPWHVGSDYQLEINLGNNRLVSMRLTGATVATPQPCESESCPPPVEGAAPTSASPSAGRIK